MPRCEGLPYGPCPSKTNDSTVVIGKGDLMLCQSCDTERHRLFDEAAKLKSARPMPSRSGSTGSTGSRTGSTTKSLPAVETGESTTGTFTATMAAPQPDAVVNANVNSVLSIIKLT